MRRSALDIAAEADLRPQAIPAGLDTSTLVSGILIEIDTDRNRALVSVNGSEGIWMPYADVAYTAGEMVMVSRNPMPGATGMYCLGPIGGTPSVPLPGAPGGGSTSETVTVAIAPVWTGSYRASSGRYDDWNVGRTAYGGRPTLYQGSMFGSGAMTGLALYGNQIVNLGATAITAMKLTLRDAGLALGTRPAMTFRASTTTAASGAPVADGPTMTAAALAKGAVGELAIDSSLFEGFRTGTYKALCTAGTGAEYNAVRGTSDADGMVLTITYTRPI